MFSKNNDKLSHNQTSENKRTQQPTKRLSEGVQKKGSLSEDDGSVTQRVSHSIAKAQKNQWYLNVRQIMKDLAIDQLHSIFVEFQTKTRRIHQRYEKQENHQLFQQRINQFQSQCILFKAKLQSKIKGNCTNHCESQNSSSQKQKNTQLTQLLKQIYELRQKVRKYERQDRKDPFFASSIEGKSSLQISNPFSSPQIDHENQNINPNINIQHKDHVKKNQDQLKKMKRDKLKLVQIHHSYLQLKTGFLSICGCLWKAISIISPESSEQIFQLINTLRKNQLKGNLQCKRMDLSSLHKIMQKSNNDLLTFSNFIDFVLKKLIVEQSSKQESNECIKRSKSKKMQTFI